MGPGRKGDMRIKYGNQEIRNRRNGGKEAFLPQRRGGAEEMV
jgi:hypothetical protein